MSCIKLKHYFITSADSAPSQWYRLVFLYNVAKETQCPWENSRNEKKNMSRTRHVPERHIILRLDLSFCSSSVEKEIEHDMNPSASEFIRSERNGLPINHTNIEEQRIAIRYILDIIICVFYLTSSCSFILTTAKPSTDLNVDSLTTSRRSGPRNSPSTGRRIIST